MRHQIKKSRKRVGRSRVLAVSIVVVAIAVVSVGTAHLVTSRRLAASAASASDNHRLGLKSLALTDDQMYFTVVTKNPDGSMSRREVVGRQQADRLVRSSESGLMSGKEHGVEP